MDVPKLKLGEYYVIRADYANGKVMNNDDTYYQSSGENYYRVFQSMLSAKSHIENESNNSKRKCEYLIHDYAGNFIEMIK